MRLTTAIGFTPNLPKMLEKVPSNDGTFFLHYLEKSNDRQYNFVREIEYHKTLSVTNRFNKQIKEGEICRIIAREIYTKEKSFKS